MLSNVIEYYRPSNNIEARAGPRDGSFLGVLPTMDLSSPIAGNAVDSLCYAHFASQSNDRNLLVASQASYGKTLHALTVELANPGRRERHHRATCYGIMVISLYGAPKFVEHSQESDWEIHYWGLHQYLQTVGPSALDLRNEFDTRLYLNLRGPFLFLSLARRRSLVFARADWRRAARLSLLHSIDKPAGVAWYEIASRMPGHLEQADRLMGSYQGGDISHLLKAFRAINNFCDELIDWLLVQDAMIQPRRVTTYDTDAFDLSIEEHIFILLAGVDSEFPLYEIASAATMNNQVAQVWHMCLMGKCTLLRFFNLKGFSDSQTPGLKESIEMQAYNHARRLCGMVFSISRLRAVANAHYMCVYLRLACAFFDEINAHQESDWCRGCLDATERRIRRIEKTEPPIICRIAILGKVGMSESLMLNHVRFKQRLQS